MVQIAPSGSRRRHALILLTGFRVDAEICLALQDAVGYPGAVAVRGVISICGSDLDNRRSCVEGKKDLF